MASSLLPCNTYSSILLLWVHTTHFPYLSLNVIREVGEYIGTNYLFPCLFAYQLRLYDLKTGHFLTKSTTKKLDLGGVLSLINASSLTCIGSQLLQSLLFYSASKQAILAICHL